MLRAKFIKAFLRKWRKLGTEVLGCRAYDHRQWARLGCTQEEGGIPKDVPKGHMVVYVGEEFKRFVIRVAVLDHPLFRALLDRAREVYEFNPDSKLRIPCDESIFLTVLHYVGSQQDQRFWLQSF